MRARVDGVANVPLPLGQVQKSRALLFVSCHRHPYQGDQRHGGACDPSRLPTLHSVVIDLTREPAGDGEGETEAFQFQRRDNQLAYQPKGARSERRVVA